MRKFVSVLVLVGMLSASGIAGLPGPAQASDQTQTENAWVRLGATVLKFLRDKAPYIYILIDEFMEDLGGCGCGDDETPPPPPAPDDSV